MTRDVLSSDDSIQVIHMHVHIYKVNSVQLVCVILVVNRYDRFNYLQWADSMQCYFYSIALFDVIFKQAQFLPLN